MNFLKKRGLGFASMVLLATAVACGSLGTGGSSGGVTGSVGGTAGQLNASDGTPIAGAAVAISTSGSSSLTRYNLRNANGRYLRLPKLTDGDGTSCDDIDDLISGTVLASDCTGTDGAYELTADDIPCGESVTFSAKKGSFFLSITITLTCTDDETDVVEMAPVEFDDDCGLDSDEDGDSDEDASLSLAAAPRYTTDTCSFDSANMAVVTGAYDEIENVLAKLGFGEVDDYGQLDTSADYDFDLIDGGYSADAVMTAEELLSDIEAMNEYDIIFINCGTSYESLLSEPDVLANIQEYVEGGGKLYVTDLSYDYLEQAFPDFMDFYGGSSLADADTAETLDAAQVGTSGITSDATVNDETMAEWLDNVMVNDGDIEEDCYFLSEAAINAKEGARNDDGTVTIGDFLSGWGVMVDTHDGVDEEATIWITGPIDYYGGSDDDAPLTVTQAHGEGEILYSSYHTAHSCPTLGFWPQERVLQYLVFEL